MTVTELICDKRHQATGSVCAAEWRSTRWRKSSKSGSLLKNQIANFEDKLKIETLPPFEEFFAKSEESTNQTLIEHREAVEILRRIHGTFHQILEATEKEAKVGQVLLLMSAMMTWLASIREASTGHLSASMPLFRASLEAACYAYRIWEEVDLYDVWLNRHSDEESRKLCRKRFNSAVRDTARNIVNRDFVWSGTDEWIITGYESALDFGAHPNLKSIQTSLQVDEHRIDNMVSISLAGVFGSGSFQVKRLLLASIEYGQQVTLIGACCTDDPDEQVLKTLGDINEKKEAYFEAEFEVEA